MMWATRNADPARTEPLLSPLFMVVVVLMSAVTTRQAATHSNLWRDMATRVVLTAVAALIVVQVVVFGVRPPLDFLTAFIRWNGFVSAEVVVLVFTGLLWLRGILIGRADVLREDLESMFYTGIFALVVLLLFDAAHPIVPFAHVLWSALIFFVASLLALALVGPSHAHFWQRETSGVRLILNRYWLVTIAAVIGLMVLAGLVFAGSAQDDFYGLLRQTVIGVITALTFVIQVIVSVLLQIVVWLLTPLIPLFERLGLMLGDVLNKVRPPAGLTSIDTATQAAESALRSDLIAGITRGLAVIAILLILLVFCLLVLIRLGFISLRRNPDETHESIASRELLMKQLRDWLNRWRGKTVAATAPPYLPLNDDDARHQIRRVYQRFLDWASSIDRARAPRQTPAMLSAALGDDRPDRREALAALTDVYERARYSIEPLTSAESRIAQDSLVTLQAPSVIKSSTADR